jgi:hypothetical protein
MSITDKLHDRVSAPYGHGDPATRIDPAQVGQLLAVVRVRLAEARAGT